MSVNSFGRLTRKRASFFSTDGNFFNTENRRAGRRFFCKKKDRPRRNTTGGGSLIGRISAATWRMFADGKADPRLDAVIRLAVLLMLSCAHVGNVDEKKKKKKNTCQTLAAHLLHR